MKYFIIFSLLIFNTNCLAKIIAGQNNSNEPPETLLYYTNVAAMEAVRPVDGTMVITGGYWTMGDGGGGKYYFNAASTETDNNGTVQTPTTGSGAGRWLLIIENSAGISPRQFGAKGNNNSAAFDDPAFVSLFAWVKSVFQANLNGIRNERFPKGITINLGFGSYVTTSPMPWFTGLHIVGGNLDANENANNTLWTCRGTTTFIYSDLSGTYNGADIDDLTIQGIAFYGAQNLTVGFIPPFTGTQIRNSKILNCGFRYLKKIDIYGIVLHLQKNYFNFMPEGVLRMGASDCVISENVIGGGGFTDTETVPNVRRAAANSFVRTVELQSFGNSRFDNNYISGDFTSPSPIPLYIENSFTSEFDGNWYDYSDGPNIQIRVCNNLTFTGGIVQGSNRLNPNVAGGLWGTRGRCLYWQFSGYCI